MIRKSKIKTRLILTYTLILSVFSIVMLIIFFSLFNKQAHVIHSERMKEQGDTLTKILLEDNTFEQNIEEENTSHHERMMRRRNQMSNATNYLSLISQLSKDDIYVVDENGEAISSSHMKKNNLSNDVETMFTQLNKEPKSVFFEKEELSHTNKLGYGVPILNSENKFLGAVIILSDNTNYFLGLGKDFYLLFLSILIALVLTVLLAIFIAKKFVKPIHDMSDFTEELIHMNYEATLDLKTQDELSELGNKLSILSSRLQYAQKEQDNKEANQKLFLSQISHELRTPVMVIRNSLEALSGTFLNEEEKQSYINHLLHETDQLSLLVNDLLELSRLQITEFSIVEEVVNLNDVVQDGIRSYRPIFEEKNKKINLTTKLDETDELTGDYHRLLQLTKILIDNSLKYSPKESVIDITLYSNKADVILEVINDSIENLDSFDTDMIFEAFNRGGQSAIKGHGIGLTIASQIVNRHKGKIKMEVISNEKIKVSVSIPK